MTYRTYTKTAKTLDEQVALLISRGMLIPDVAKAQHTLASVSYYRLRPYWIPYQDTSQTSIDGEHPFFQGTSFSTVFRVYRFDRKLRILLVDAIERLEVSIKSQFAYHMANNRGLKALEDSSLFQDPGKHATALTLLKRAWNESKEDFARHYRNNYANTFLVVPPPWVSVELMTFTQISKWIGNLKDTLPEKAEIAKHHGLHTKVFVQLIQHLAVVRNICAHHSRL